MTTEWLWLVVGRPAGREQRRAGARTREHHHREHPLRVLLVRSQLERAVQYLAGERVEVAFQLACRDNDDRSRPAHEDRAHPLAKRLGRFQPRARRRIDVRWRTPDEDDNLPG